MPACRTIDEYIASSPREVQPVLESIRATIRRAAPLAQERISYGIPAYFQGKVLVYFGAFKKHIGFYPPIHDQSLKVTLAQYAGPKGNLQFPLSEPMPLEHIAEIVKARLKEVTAPAPKSQKSSRVDRS
jgi:uncharacterized protein YdhG (YjbR/CyaY superfamily)